MKYSDKLKDPRWQRKRLEILKRDGFKCMCCLSKNRMLSIHHKYYRTDLEPWDYPNRSLITLCQDCHNVHNSIDFKTLWRRRIKLRIVRFSCLFKRRYFTPIIFVLFKILRLRKI